MKGVFKIAMLLFLCFQFEGIWAFASDSTGNDIFEIERKTIVQRIGFEKVRIANDYKNADGRFGNLVDSLTTYVNTQNISKEKRNQYLRRLQVFLENINRYYSETYLKNGTYLAALSYFPVLLEWDLKDELLRNIKRYSNFSIKAIRLVPSDTIAEDFLTDYLNDHPDDVFRFAEEFDDRKFAMRMLEKAVRLAPESAKRYFTSPNTVNEILSNSRDPYVVKSYEIYNRFGIKSRAYLLLDAIVKGNMSVAAADSLGGQPEKMFALLVDLSMKYEANVTYSIYRYMDIYCNDAMRKLNEEILNNNFTYESFKKHSPEEMFVLLGYGYKQTTEQTMRALLGVLAKKATGIPISSVMITSMDKEKLKEMVLFCDQHELLDVLLALVDDEKKDYLLALTSLEEREDLFPPFKSFAKENVKVQEEPEDRALNEITKARPPQPVTPDTESNPEPTAKPGKIELPSVTGEKPENQPVKEIATPEPVAEAKKDIVPIPPPEIIEPIQIDLDYRTRSILSLKKNILQSLQDIPGFIDKDYGEEILRYAAEKEPDEMFKKIEQYRNKRYSLNVLEQCAVNAPVSLKRYLYNTNHPVNYILGYSQNLVVKKILEINPELGYHSKPLLLLDDIIGGRMTVAEAITISNDPVKLFSAVVKIISRSTYFGKYSIDHEMRDYSLRFIREINDKIASGNNQPFYAVEGFNAQELYFLMLYGRDEVFTSTFNGLFNRLLLKIPNTGGEVFLKSISRNRFRDFLSLCANYGVMEDFLGKFKAEEKQQLLTDYISDLESEQDDLSSIVLVAEAINNVTDNQILAALERSIKDQYERVKADSNQIGMSIYGVLSSIISSNVKVEPAWYKKLSQQFVVSPATSLPNANLFSGSVCAEQMYFYNDDDGRGSFINFMNTYKGQANWVVEDRSSYVRIYSVSGKQVEILANKPEFEENGISAIDAYLADRKLKPAVIVHRGHSFHTEATLEKVPAEAKLIFVGSCGGFYKISVALENAPNAHIIATKQVGTKNVNDVMIFALNDMIREGRDIVWNEFWDRMKEKLGSNQYFRDYIPPHKNLESIFIKAYYKILGV